MFDRKQFENKAGWNNPSKKDGGKVEDKFLTAEFARLYPDYPHEIYEQTEKFGKADLTNLTMNYQPCLQTVRQIKNRKNFCKKHNYQY